MPNSTWTSRRTGIVLGFCALFVGSVGVSACDDDEVSPSIVLAGEDPLFPGFSYDTGLLPGGSPVQASFSVVAKGATTVSAEAIASGSSDEPTLSGVAETGALNVAGSFGLEGRLVVDMSGLPSYDGPIPGIENVAIDFSSAAAFDPFSIGTAVTTRADIPPAQLPEIPLPGGIPGGLVLEVAEGSFVEVTLTGTQACVGGEEAYYAVELSRAGTVVIRPSIVIDVPLIGSQTFEIPTFEVPLDLGSTALDMSASIPSFGAKPESGDHVSQACSGDGAGGQTSAGGGGPGGSPTTGGAGGTGGSGTACTSAADCGGLPCVEGSCSPGGGVCDSGTTVGDDALDACITASCCEQMATCTYDYSDIDGCNACIGAGFGDRCDGLLTCVETSCGGGPPGWTCNGMHYDADDGCDCGCGILDPDCPDPTVDSCQFCDGAGSCATGACPANIDPDDNAQCL